jgi:hypothetical protein
MRKLTKTIILFLFLSSICLMGYSEVIYNALLRGSITGDSDARITIDSISVANLVATEKVLLDIAAGSLVLQDGTVLYFTDGTEADSAYISHDGTDLVITGDDGTTAIELEGLELELSNGATVVNTSTSLLTLTEATVDVVGALTASSMASDATVTAASTMSTGANSGTSGQVNFIASDNDQGNIVINTSDNLTFSGFSGGVDVDGDFTAGTVASDGAVSGTTITGTGKISTLLTTEQLRLSYDANNYATWTVAADGALTLVTVDASATEGDVNLNPDGYVGIKTAVPTVELDVTGAGKFSTDLTVTGGDVTGANGNAIDIGEATDGTITFSRDDAGTVTLTNADNDADADLTLSAGGSGALTVGDVGSTTAISSSDWAISTTGDMTGIGTITTDSVVSIGGWGYTGEHVSIPEASSNTNACLGVYGMVDYDATGGKVFAGTYSRMLAIDSNQANQASMYGTESQFRLRDVDIADGDHAGIWAYAEQSGTSELSGNGTFSAISATVESEAGFTVGATEHVTGITIDASINGSASIDASANYSAIYIKSNGKDWFDGIKITGVDNDIKLQNDEIINNATDGVIDMSAANVRSATYNFANAAAVTGSADSIVIDFDPDLDSLPTGQMITFIAEAANTAATTLIVDGGAEKNIYESSDISELEANDIRSGTVVQIVFDGTQWQQISQSGN